MRTSAMIEANAVVKIDNKIIPLTESTDIIASHPDKPVSIDFTDAEAKKDKSRPSFSSPQSKPLSQYVQADPQVLRVFLCESL